MASGKCEVTLMSLNCTKAGMEGLDKAAVNAIIDEVSKGSKFYEAKAKAQERIDVKKEALTQKLKTLSDEAIHVAEGKADKIIQDILLTENDISQVIVHVDMDAFYAAVEEKDDPSLKICAMAVGSMGMLSTSNYLARKFGVRAGMPGFIGKKLCPQLKIVPLNFDKYRAASEQVREVFKTYDPNFCPMSLDEAYLNLTDFMLSHPSLSPGEVVHEMRAKIHEVAGLTASAGISRNTMVAKICSDQKKPNGQFELMEEESMKEFISALSVRKVGGIGNVTEQLLQVVGVESCKDILEKRGAIFLLFSELTAARLFEIALAVGGTDVADMANSERKSMSSETTFKDTSQPEKLKEICKELCDDLASGLKKEKLYGRQVTVKIKTHRFEIKTKVSNLGLATNDSALIYQTAVKILGRFIDTCSEKPLTLRLLGVRMSELSSEDSESSGHGSDQKSIMSFFKNMPTFECPLCFKSIQAANEREFNISHFEKCMKVDDNDDIEEGIANQAAASCVSRDHKCESSDAPVTASTAFGVHPNTMKSSPCSSSQVAEPRGVSSQIKADSEVDLVACPVCQKKWPLDSMNSHIDLCLNREALVDVRLDHNSQKPKRKLELNTNRPNKKTKTASIKSYFTSSMT